MRASGLFVLVSTLAVVPARGQPSVAAARVLVMPFDNVDREPRIYWLGEASAILLTNRLNLLGGQAITRSERVRAFERLHLPSAPSLTHATVIRVGETVGAGDVIVGRLSLSGNELSVHARRIRLDTGRMQPELVERGPLAGLFAIFDRLARRLTPSDADQPPPDDPPLEAFEQYVKGLLAETPDNQVKYLESALKLAPRYDSARVALWDVLTALGDHARALAAVTAVRPEGPEFRRATFLAGLSHLSLKQHDEAFAVWKLLLDAHPDGELYNNLGVVQARRGSTAQSGRPTYYFDKATDADPIDPDYCFNLGYAYWMERDVQAATYWLREAVRRNPADGDAHFVLGAALHASGAATEAAREKDLARRLSSKYDEWDRRASAAEPVPRGLERVKTDLGAPVGTRVDPAAETLQRDQRELAAFHLDRGRRLFEQGRDSEAIAELRRAVFSSPYLAESHLLLGRAHLRSGQPREAIDALKISLWSEETAAAHVVLGEAYLQAADRAAARTEALRALAIDPASADAKALLDKIERPDRQP